MIMEKGARNRIVTISSAKVVAKSVTDEVILHLTDWRILKDGEVCVVCGVEGQTG